MARKEALRVENMVAASIEDGPCPSLRDHPYNDEVLQCCLPAGHGTEDVLPEKRWHYGWSKDGGQYAWQGSDEDGFAEDAREDEDRHEGGGFTL